MDHPIITHCSIEESTGRFKIGDASFSVSGNSPNATCTFGRYNLLSKKFERADRMTGCQIQDLPGGVMIVTGTQRSAVTRKGASPEEAKMTIRVSPGINPNLDIEVDGEVVA